MTVKAATATIRRMAGPFLKWAGGKGKLAPIIAQRAPRGFNAYYEPFAGAGAVFFALEEGRRGMAAMLNDLNEPLMEAFLVVRDDVGKLIDELHRIAMEYANHDEAGRKDYYYRVRAQQPSAAMGRAARFIFLNRTGYNGLYRVNRSGGFNVPHGRYTNPRILHGEGLVEASKALRNSELMAVDFEAACAEAARGDFVYLDPPYQPLSATSYFTSYTSEEFSEKEQRRLRDVFEDLTRRGIAAVLSNSSHPLIRELYDGRGYSIETVQMSRAINSNGKKRSPIDELLIDNFERVGAASGGVGEVGEELEPL